MELMTEVQDLRHLLESNVPINDRMAIYQKIFSYDTHEAIYDPETNTVETLFFEEPMSLVYNR